MQSDTKDSGFLFIFRLLMAWTFLFAASHQVGNARFSAAAFLKQTKTFHDVYAPLTAPSLDPILTFLVSYGHLLIGLSLLVGLFVRVSASCGVLLLMLYWTAHMDWPYIENQNNFIVDYHIVYSVVLVLLAVKGAGKIWGLDAWVAGMPIVRNNALLRWAAG